MVRTISYGWEPVSDDSRITHLLRTLDLEELTQLTPVIKQMSFLFFARGKPDEDLLTRKGGTPRR